MGFYKHQPVVVVPASKLEQFNAILQRQGYGPGNMTTAVVGKGEKDSKAAATHYVLECVADEGLLAAIQLALKTIASPQAKVEVFSKPAPVSTKQTRADEVLAKADLKTKTAINIEPAPKEEVKAK